jgi:hypothetical protein
MVALVDDRMPMPGTDAVLAGLRRSAARRGPGRQVVPAAAHRARAGLIAAAG